MDDDRRAVPAQGPWHHGRPGTVAGLLFHIRHGQGVARTHDCSRNGPDHVAIRRRRGRGRVLRRRVPARDPGQEPAPDRKAVRRQRRRRRRRVPGEELQTRRHCLHRKRLPVAVRVRG